MIRNPNKQPIILMAIGSLMVLEGIAMLTHTDGRFLGLTMALIGALAGVPLGVTLTHSEKRNKLLDKLHLRLR